MPLDEREQRILQEIERQFYEEDPKLAQTVANTTLESVHRRWQRVAVVGFFVGLVVMLVFFPSSTIIAVGGFIVMLVSVGWVTMNLRRGASRDVSGAVESWVERVRQRWRREG